MDSRPAHALRPLSVEAQARAPSGAFVELDGEPVYRISAYRRLDPFLMSLASDADLWLFVTSEGGLTAGRVDAEGSLFPYRIVDQLHDAHHHTGPLTLIRVVRAKGEEVLWQPFSEASAENPTVEHNLYKNIIGNRLTFEEHEHTLGLIFGYRWAGSDEFGWVRTATLQNRGPATIRLFLLDGLRNIMPYGVPLSLSQQTSNLVDAYKKNEADPQTGLGIFALTSGITDRAEALEVLRANTFWCCGLEGFRVHLSPEVVTAFRHGRVLSSQRTLNGCRGNYFVSSCLELEPGQAARWHLAGDVGRDHLQIVGLRQRLLAGEDLAGRIEASLDRATESLRRNVASADGLQLCGRPESWSHHLANVLFNNMRGGVFAQNHDVPTADFAEFLSVRNRPVAERCCEQLAALPETLTVEQLRAWAHGTQAADLARLSHEYLPLYFGRRHGDPSRPWNRFEIRMRKRNGERILSYEGNWRDIFQNWEALGVSFPAFLPSMVAKFVNASTVDGFNPYRLSREGIDWEMPAPDDPWRNIGYWGDHQIVYLLKLLEALDRYQPTAIAALLGAEIFSYAEVPYRLKPYAEICRDPRATIVYDGERAARIAERVARQGTDGKLLEARDGSVYHANLLEKLLVPTLSKLSNFVPDAGIWMNTQRPEWNDANNALGGGGVSVVTLCYLRRYLAFLAELCGERTAMALPVSAEIVVWFERIAGVLEAEQDRILAGELDARNRRRLMDALGEAFSAYRQTVYAHGFSGRRDVALRQVVALCRSAVAWIDRSIAANRREDGLYHTYNLLEPAAAGAGIAVKHLPEMLEGQVAILSSGALDPAAGLAVLERLFASDLFRADQGSFLLYPERDRPGFLDRNAVPEARVQAIPLLRDLLEAGNPSLLARDAAGVCRFNGDFRQGRDLEAALEELARQPAWSQAAVRDRTAVLELFEHVFRHRAYTGRSGVMYGFEGIGCIYWHMVAKLLLAAQENVLRAEREDLPATVRRDLVRMYYRIRSGLGYQKTVAEYGAFPTDPYSHTPAAGGAKQPGMTGQVKEEILTRLGELGVLVEGGAVRFRPILLQAGEFLNRPAVFSYYDVQGQGRTLPLAAGSLAFTLCQVPVVYELMASGSWLEIVFTDGSVHRQPEATLDPLLATEIFMRSGRIARLRIAIAAGMLD